VFDHRARTQRLQEKMVANDLDGAVLFRPEHIYYFAGFRGASPIRYVGLVVPASGPPTLISPAIEAAYVKDSTWIDDVRIYVEWATPKVPESPVPVIGEVIREKSLARGKLGIECSFVPSKITQDLQSEAPKTSFDDVDPVCLELRMVKEPAELDVMRKAGRVAIAEVEAAIATVAPGVPEYEISLAVSVAGSRAAAEFLGPEERRASPLVGGIQILVTEARRAEWVHGRASTYRVKTGDIVALCFCDTAHFRGYNIGFDRPVAVGPLTKDQERLLRVAREANEAAMQQIRPGEEACSVDSAANSVLSEAGCIRYRLHRTGRGVGTAPVERPEIRSSDKTVLRPGMTFTVEPGVYIPGVGAARFGDTVAVTETGCENITPFSKNWLNWQSD
jgi:Xaa-Pro dipeptidase